MWKCQSNVIKIKQFNLPATNNSLVPSTQAGEEVTYCNVGYMRNNSGQVILTH